MNRSRPVPPAGCGAPREMSSIDIGGEPSAEVSLVGGVDGKLEPLGSRCAGGRATGALSDKRIGG
jgi:hypothetical protein